MASDEEVGKKKTIKKQLSSGKLLVDDPGWLGPLNSLVWASPNSMLYIMVVVGAIVYYIMTSNGHSSSSVRRPDRPTKRVEDFPQATRTRQDTRRM